MARFTIKDIAFATLLAGMALGWLVDHTSAARQYADIEARCELQERIIKQRDLLVLALRNDIYNLRGPKDVGLGVSTPSRGPADFDPPLK